MFSWMNLVATHFLTILALSEQSNAFIHISSPSCRAISCQVTIRRFQVEEIRNQLLDCFHPGDGDTKIFSTIRFIQRKSDSQSRRDALLSLILSSCAAPTAVAATNGGSEYTPAKRATAYFVDSTIPPTLVPYSKPREAAILKSLGNGYGTLKDLSLLDTAVNLNNIMNKTISGIYGQLSSSKNAGQPLDSSFVFFGMDFASNDDVRLSIDLIKEIIKPRLRNLSSNTALGLSWAPQSTQSKYTIELSVLIITLLRLLLSLHSFQFICVTASFDIFFNSSIDQQASIEGLTAALLKADVSLNVISSQLPLLIWARSSRLPLVALAPLYSDLIKVRENGLQSLDFVNRETYVADTKGFINMVQNPKFKLYTNKSLLKEYEAFNLSKNPDEDGDIGNFFAESILHDEAVATASAKWAHQVKTRTSSKGNNSLMIILSAFERVRFLGGANGRVLRVYQFLSPDSKISEEAVTSILLNPTAKVCCLNRCFE